MPPIAAIAAGAVIGGGLGLASGIKQAKAQKRAGRIGEAAAQESIAEQRRQFELSQQLTAPRREAEDEAINALRGFLGIGGEGFDFSGFEQTPGFQFARDEALRAAERSASARGGLASGNTLAELQRRAGGLASQFVGQNFLNPLQNLALGGAQQQAGQNALALGSNIGRTGQEGAAARASGITGAAQAFGQGLGSLNQAIQGGLGNFLLQGQLGGGAPAGGGTQIQSFRPPQISTPPLSFGG